MLFFIQRMHVTMSYLLLYSIALRALLTSAHLAIYCDNRLVGSVSLPEAYKGPTHNGL